MFYRVAQQLAVCLGLMLVVGLSSGCQKAGEPSVEPPQPKLATPEGAPFDVDAVIRQVHFAYRQEEDGWRGQHATYEVQARPEGLVLTPVRYTELSEPPPRMPRARGFEELEELAPRVQAERGAPLKLGAAQLTRGAVSLSTSRPRGQVEADGHLTSNQFMPAVTFDGTSYVVGWADFRDNTFWDIYAVQVTSGAVVSSSPSLAAYEVRAYEPYVALASAGGQQSLIAYSRYDTEPSTGSRRIRGRFITY